MAMPEKWQQQFSATVSGSASTGVTWTVSKDTGTITQSDYTQHRKLSKPTLLQQGVRLTIRSLPLPRSQLLRPTQLLSR